MTILKSFLRKIVSAPHMRAGFVRHQEPFLLLEAFGGGIVEQGRK